MVKFQCSFWIKLYYYESVIIFTYYNYKIYLDTFKNDDGTFKNNNKL